MATVPSFLLNKNDFSLGAAVDTTTLELSDSPSSFKIVSYVMKRNPVFIKPSQFKYSLDLVKPETFVEDIARLLKVPKSLIFRRYNCDKIENLMKHFLGKSGVLINFYICDKYKTFLTNSNKKEDPMITRIDYGYQFFAVVQALTDKTDETFKNMH